MLQRLTDSLETRRWLWYTILGALCVVFAAWGAYGLVNLNFGGASWAAKVNGQQISLQEARDAWQRAQGQIAQQYGGSIPSRLRRKLQNQVLEGLIQNTLMAQRTEKLGYRVSQADLISAIRSEPAFQVSGKYSPQAAQDALSEANLSLPQFESELSSELRRQQLIAGIRSSDFLTPLEVARAQALQNQQRKVQYVIFPASRYRSDAPIGDAAIEAYYKAHQSQYMIPESVDLRYGELTLAQVEAGEKVTDAQLHAAYDKHRSQFVTPQQREASHILIQFGKNPKAALAKAKHILALARSGKSFAALARKYSQDPGSARKGGKLGWVSRNGFVKPFAHALFAIAKVGDIVGPVKTQYGYHIIRLDGIRPAHTQTFQEAKPTLLREVRHREATSRFGDIEDSLQNEAQDTGATLAGLAKTFNLTTGRIPQFLRGKGAQPLGRAPAVQNLVFGSGAISPGTLAGPVILDNNKMVVIEVKAQHGPQVKPLSEVRSGIVAALKRQRDDQAALAAARAARSKVLGGESFDQLAKTLKLKVDPAKFIGRDDPSVPSAIDTVAFAAPRPTHGPVYEAKILSGGGAALVAVSAVRSGPQTNSDMAHTLQERQIRSDADGDAQAYIAQMRATAKVVKNPKPFQ